jgi:hypothetical protein
MPAVIVPDCPEIADAATELREAARAVRRSAIGLLRQGINYEADVEWYWSEAIRVAGRCRTMRRAARWMQGISAPMKESGQP